MKRYLEHLLSDIEEAIAKLPVAPEGGYDIWDWVSEEEEERTAPVRNLQEWTGIYADMLPPESMLSDEEVHLLLEALNKMLNEYNWSFVMQIEVPERIQYQTIKENFNQDAKVKEWHMGFFEVCRPGTKHMKCSLGEYCHCAFFAELFKDMVREDLTPEEERAMQLRCEITHLQRKHGDEWMKYYPYHLDPEYDDEYGNPHDYGFGDDDGEEDYWDDWWKR